MNPDALADPITQRLGEEEWRRQALAGGYLMLVGREVAPSLPTDAPRVTVAAVGAVVSEAIEAVRFLIDEEVDANLVVVTSADRLSAELHSSRLTAIREGGQPRAGHLEQLFPDSHRRAPIVTGRRS